MALLLKNIRLRLPFPNQKLAEFRRAKSKPFTGFVDGDIINSILRDREGLNLNKVWEFVQGKQTRGKADDQQVCVLVKCTGSDMGISLVKKCLLTILQRLVGSSASSSSSSISSSSFSPSLTKSVSPKYFHSNNAPSLAMVYIVS